MRSRAILFLLSLQLGVLMMGFLLVMTLIPCAFARTHRWLRDHLGAYSLGGYLLFGEKKPNSLSAISHDFVSPAGPFGRVGGIGLGVHD